MEVFSVAHLSNWNPYDFRPLEHKLPQSPERRPVGKRLHLCERPRLPGEGDHSRSERALDDKDELCPPDLVASLIANLDHELAKISMAEAIAGHVRQSLDGLLFRFPGAAEDKPFVIGDEPLAVVGIEVVPLASGNRLHFERVFLTVWGAGHTPQHFRPRKVPSNPGEG